MKPLDTFGNDIWAPADGILQEILDRRTLFVGEVNTGKTLTTSRILKELASAIKPERITVLDLAPLVPEALAAQKGLTGVGGRVDIPDHPGILVLRTRIDPPRLLGTDENEVLAMARGNLERIRKLLGRFVRSSRDVLLINDLTMCLQAGTAEDLTGCLATARTVVANGYQGRKLGTGSLSVHESREMNRILPWFDRVVELRGIMTPLAWEPKRTK